MTRRLAFGVIATMLLGSGCVENGSVPQAKHATTKEEVRVEVAPGAWSSYQEEYLVDVRTGERTLAEIGMEPDWAGFSGMAPDAETDSVSRAYGPIYGKSGSEALVRVISYDVSHGESDFGGFPVRSRADYFCDLPSRACEPTTILSDAAAAADPSVNFYRWDPESHRVFGNPAGEGAGNMNAAYAYDYAAKILTRTDAAEDAYVPPSYDASFGRVAVYSPGETPVLRVYDTRDLSKPSQTVSLDPLLPDEQIGRTFWSPDGTLVAVEASRHVYVIDLSSGFVAFSVEARAGTSSAFSSGGSFLAYVGSRDGKDVLVSLDLASGETREVLSDGYLRLLERD